MATYEDVAGLDVAQAANFFGTQTAAGNLSAATMDSIASLLEDIGMSSDEKPVAVPTESITAANLAEQALAPIVLMNPGQSVGARDSQVTFDAASGVQALILSANDGVAPAPSNVKFTTDRAVTVQLGGADGDNVATAGGNDSVTFNGGEATISTGAGDDTVVIQGQKGLLSTVEVTAESGNNTFEVNTDLDAISATINAGDGWDSLLFTAARNTFKVVFEAGRFVMKKVAATAQSDDVAVDDGVMTLADDGVMPLADAKGDGIAMTGVDVILTGEDGTDALALTANKDALLVSRIYEVALGRSIGDNMNSALVDGEVKTSDLTADQRVSVDGYTFWTEQLQAAQSGWAAPGQAKAVVMAMLGSGEFADNYGNVNRYTDEQFVNALLKNVDSCTVDGHNSDYYVQQLHSGVTRAEVAFDIATSMTAVQNLNPEGLNTADYYIDFGA